MVAINKKMVNNERNINSGILLSIFKHNYLVSDVARQVIEEWCKHVSCILNTCVSFICISFCCVMMLFNCSYKMSSIFIENCK